MKKILLIFFVFNFYLGFGQNCQLTVQKIMQDPKWIGSSPSNIFWAPDGSKLYFYWNPEKAYADSLYYIVPGKNFPIKATAADRRDVVNSRDISYNAARSAYVYSSGGDIWYKANGKNPLQVTATTDMEFNAQFSFDDTKIVFQRSGNLYAWDIATGATNQLTNFTRSLDKKPLAGKQEEWLKNDQLATMSVLAERKRKRDAQEAWVEANKQKTLKSIVVGESSPAGLSISRDGRFIQYRIDKPSSGKQTIVPSYVTESGYTTDIPSRPKVGESHGASEWFVHDTKADSVIKIKTDDLEGIKDVPSFKKDYAKSTEDKSPVKKVISIWRSVWSPDGKYLLCEVRSADNKDRWLVVWDTLSKGLRTVSHQYDEAWIGGPGISSQNIGWINGETVWFQSEQTGYSHLYTFNIPSARLKALTSGNFEIQSALLSTDKKSFYVTTNQQHPGEQHFYKLDISSLKMEQLTKQTGANNCRLSPDEKYIAYLHSYSTQPWELFLQENKVGAVAKQITDKAKSEAFKACSWIDPEVLTFKATDGSDVYARLYKPAEPDAKRPAVIFVHGAGYLQNAHKWWSNYFREYMFHNLLAQRGYYVMDIDYRGSAGYGRNWRTGIYRHMGGKDLTDHIDAAAYLVKTFGVQPDRIGIYGGSYGGFITLMAMFTKPDAFAAGAALRPVTDWANYNDGYTSNILNEPFTDSIAYRKSSPIYYADGLKGHLLICHGVVDENVHFQDAVKLAQRLIELGKDNWELAMYPVEDHGFVEPSSWTDEYKRILKLFETVLKR